MSFQRDATLAAKTVANAKLVENPDGASVNRLAWAFACAKKDSDEESAMYRLLVERIAKILDERKERP